MNLKRKIMFLLTSLLLLTSVGIMFVSADKFKVPAGYYGYYGYYNGYRPEYEKTKRRPKFNKYLMRIDDNYIDYINNLGKVNAHMEYMEDVLIELQNLEARRIRLEKEFEKIDSISNYYKNKINNNFKSEINYLMEKAIFHMYNNY